MALLSNLVSCLACGKTFVEGVDGLPTVHFRRLVNGVAVRCSGGMT